MKSLSKLAWLIFLCFGLVNLYAIDTLEEAIEREAAYIVDRSPANTVLAIVNIKSDSRVLSEYIMERIPDYLVRNNKKITFVDRSKLDLIQQEINFQYSGEVSDDTMVSIGNKIGAQIIVTGTISEVGDVYNFSIKLLDVKTAVILGSNSTKIMHDTIMNSYLPNSQAAQIAKSQAVEAQQRKASTVRTIKNVLGIFPNGFYLGYLGSLNSPVGISLGWLNKSMAVFMDNEIGPPDFDGYERSDNLYYNGNSISGSALGSGTSYTSGNKKTDFHWDCIFGFNINIIESLLWVNLGAGINYRQDYKLFTENNSLSGSNKIWIENSNNKEEDRINFAVSAGLYVKLWYFYIQAKYKYLIGEELDYSSYGLNQLSIGIGYVWRRGK
ncbi:MAG: penicillin-binding protein activator LpoB [Treponema sp.]|jgi:TolB-like protein|nr:penicillin-binding protein activator LpoB [Treponema sp.]